MVPTLLAQQEKMLLSQRITLTLIKHAYKSLLTPHHPFNPINVFTRSPGSPDTEVFTPRRPCQRR